ncbi:hypothetical protein NDN08_000946 [Rhodosorus marinus]|uniref:Uncharacterized protein n=1 Tax=Rhodosorus marinus TaxID=101924 RepID=A0AAV8UPJ8_9RHOD|nr:hypothetical protein NDN08_000946 [Rhodosorus marinus]
MGGSSRNLKAENAHKDGSGRTRSERLSNAHPVVYSELVDSLAADEGHWCMFLRDGVEGDVKFGKTIRRSEYGRVPLGPVVVEEQEELLMTWIETKLDIKLDHSQPLAYALTSGIVLRFLTNGEAWVPSATLEGPWEGNDSAETRLDRRELRRLRRQERKDGVKVKGSKAFLRSMGVWEERRIPLPYSYYTCVRGISLFLQHLRNIGMDSNEMFEFDDLLYYRNIPKVMRCIAAYARKTDYENFAQIANQVPGAVLNWTQEDEPNERWENDRMLSDLVLAFKKASTKKRLSVLVAGAMGSGKSATIETIMGRRSMAHRHKLNLITEDYHFTPEEILERKKKRDLMSDPLLRFKLDAGKNPNAEVSKIYTKMHGIAVSITEVPGMEEYIAGSADGNCLIRARAGDFEGVRKSIAHDRYDLVLVVDRIDDYNPNRTLTACRSLSALFGPRVFDYCLFIFTHGSSLPPADLTYTEHRSRCVQASLEVANKFAAGAGGQLFPSAVIENSKSCPQDSKTGSPILPDGSDFLPRLHRAMETVLLSQHGLPSLVPKRKRPWWESWVLGGVALWIVTFGL